MNCPQCKKPNSPDAKSCSSCGLIFTPNQTTGATFNYQPRPTGMGESETIVQNFIQAERILCDQDDCRANKISAVKNATYCPYCTKILPLPAGFILGQDQRWQIESNLSNGKAGMSRVYLATDRSNGHKIVIKEMLDEQTRPQSEKQIYIDHLRNEAEVMGSLVQLRSVPNLIFPYTIYGPRHFFAMQYIEGDDLDTLVKNGSLDVNTVVNFAVSTCDVLTILHNFKPPIIHRDIKPENLRLGKDGFLRLMDFGIARTMRVNTKLTRGVGTPGYVAGEQHDGSAETRSDLFSLSATLFYLLGKQVPDNPNYWRAGALRHYNNTVSPELEEVILANLNADANERYSTADEFKQDLKQGRMTKTVYGYRCNHPNPRQNIYCRVEGFPVRGEMRECRKPHCPNLYPLRGRFCPICGTPAEE